MEVEDQLVINSTVRNRELNSSGMAIGLNGMIRKEEDPKKNRCPRCDGSCWIWMVQVQFVTSISI